MLCIRTADPPRGSPWQSPLYRGRISELLPWGVTLPQMPAAWLNLKKGIILIFRGSKKVIWEMNWTWSTEDTCGMHGRGGGWKGKRLSLSCLLPASFNYLTEFFTFHTEIVSFLLSLLAWYFCTWTSIIWLLMMNCMSCQKYNLQLNWGLYLNFLLLILAWFTQLL